MNASWTLSGGRLYRPAPFCLIGILNLTPDSFYDGGSHPDAASASAHGLRLLEQGADMLDLGAESTRPGAAPLGQTLEQACAEEATRLLPVLRRLRGARPDAILCVDTCHGRTANNALELGADVINDVSACDRDPALLEVLADRKPGYVLMHGGDKGGVVPAGEGPVIDRVVRFFERKLARLVRAGLPEDRIVLDPGIGFGKSNRECVDLLRGIERLHLLGRPLYVGLSMKSLFGELLGLPLEERSLVTAVASAFLAERGVAYHRVHDVAAARQALRVSGWFTAGGDATVRSIE